MPRKQSKGRKSQGKRLTRRQIKAKQPQTVANQSADRDSAAQSPSNTGSSNPSPISPEYVKLRQRVFNEMMATNLIIPKWNLKRILSEEELERNRAGFALLLSLASEHNSMIAHSQLAEHYFSGLDGVPETPDVIQSSQHYLSFILACTTYNACTKNIRRQMCMAVFNLSTNIGNLNICQKDMTSNEQLCLHKMQACLKQKVLKRVHYWTTRSSLDLNGIKVMLYHLLGVIYERLGERASATVNYHKCAKAGKKLSEDAKCYVVERNFCDAERRKQRIKVTENSKLSNEECAEKYAKVHAKYDARQLELKKKYPEETKNIVDYADPSKPVWRNFVCVGVNAEGKPVSRCLMNYGDFGADEKQWQFAEGDSVIRTCANCKTMGCMMDLCAGCKNEKNRVWYCSRECQKEHWRNGHSQVCAGNKQECKEHLQ